MATKLNPRINQLIAKGKPFSFDGKMIQVPTASSRDIEPSYGMDKFWSSLTGSSEAKALKKELDGILKQMLDKYYTGDIPMDVQTVHRIAKEWETMAEPNDAGSLLVWLIGLWIRIDQKGV